MDRYDNDVELWKSFIKGENAAFEVVYCRFYPLLYSYGIRMVGDRELVIDTIQNLFVKLIRNCRSLHPTNNVKAYLLCAFRHKMFDDLQALRSMETIEQSHEFFSVNDGMIDALFDKDDIDVTKEKRLANAIAKLSGRQKEILYLYYVRNLSHQEIAEVLDMNMQSSKNLLSRTMSRLKEFFFSVSTIWLFNLLISTSVPQRDVATNYFYRFITLLIFGFSKEIFNKI